MEAWGRGRTTRRSGAVGNGAGCELHEPENGGVGLSRAEKKGRREKGAGALDLIRR